MYLGIDFGASKLSVTQLNGKRCSSVTSRYDILLRRSVEDTPRVTGQVHFEIESSLLKDGGCFRKHNVLSMNRQELLAWEIFICNLKQYLPNDCWGDNTETISERLELDAHILPSPTSIAGKVIGAYLFPAQRADTAIGHSFDTIVCCVPANFADSGGLVEDRVEYYERRKRIHNTLCETLDVHKSRLFIVEEPVAAAVAARAQFGDEFPLTGAVLIVDIGSWTTDVALVWVDDQANENQVISGASFPHLGGQHIDVLMVLNTLIQADPERFGKLAFIDNTNFSYDAVSNILESYGYDSDECYLLLYELEKLKHNYVERNGINARRLRKLGPLMIKNVSIPRLLTEDETKKVCEQSFGQWYEKFFKCLEAYIQTQFDVFFKNAIEQVYVCGGSARWPNLVVRLEDDLKGILNRDNIIPVSLIPDPEEAVSRGAAIIAENVAQGGNTSLRFPTPDPLCIELHRHPSLEISQTPPCPIDKGTMLPITIKDLGWTILHEVGDDRSVDAHDYYTEIKILMDDKCVHTFVLNGDIKLQIPTLIEVPIEAITSSTTAVLEITPIDNSGRFFTTGLTFSRADETRIEVAYESSVNCDIALYIGIDGLVRIAFCQLYQTLKTTSRENNVSHFQGRMSLIAEK